MSPGNYVVRDERGRFAGVLLILEEANGPGSPAHSMWTVAYGYAVAAGQPAPPRPEGASLVRWAGSTVQWTATETELRRLGVAEPATWP